MMRCQPVIKKSLPLRTREGEEGAKFLAGSASRQDLMIVFESFPGVGNQFAIGWMIDRFDAFDFGTELGVVGVNVRHELGFCVSWPCN